MVVSPLSLDDGALCVRTGYTSTTAVRHLLYCCTTHGAWVDRFVGVTAVLIQQWVDRLVPVVCCCRVSTPVRVFFFLFFSRYTGPALA